ncbi:MAG: GNAT family N-acetyltransferase [Alphaproteobacteria bacterium]|nr:GNAT family N-acetyltransferase [Alphaproteobacteria bacterium]NCQ66298.1 GNAT family N-acetyltransferase [Alphaproteobacteria bacterium]
MISDIFSFDHPIYAKGCHTRLTGESKTGYKWELSDVQLVDIDYHVKAFRNETLMFQYGTGLPREPQATADRIVGTWMNRFLNGNPHGGMTIFNAETRERIGHIVAGGGDRPGISEIAYTLMEDSWDGRDVPKIWGKGVMSGVVGSIVNDWAPEVIRLSESNMPVCIQKAFTCFGGKPLEGFDATASPSNPGSWCVLKKHGFKAAITNVDCGETVADFDGKELEPSEFENELMKLYTVDTILETPLERGIRYHVIGTDGTLHTVSHHKNFNRMKLHLELKF